MAALNSSQVSLYPTDSRSADFNYGNTANKSLVTRSRKFTAVTVGDQTDTIGADALGFITLVSCSNFFDDTNNRVVPAVVDPVTNTIVFGAGSFSGGAAAGNVSSVTGYITITGIPK